MIHNRNQNLTFAPVTSVTAPLGALSAGLSLRELALIALRFAGVDRFLQGDTGNFGISGVYAHAAVRMHAHPVTGVSWAVCPKTKTNYFQRWKVASLR